MVRFCALVIATCVCPAAVALAQPSDEPPEANAPEEKPPEEKQREEKPPEEKSSQERIKALEDDVERLKLRTEDDEEEEGELGSAQSTSTQTTSASANVFNPTLAVIGNGLYRYDDQAVLVDDTRVDGTFNLREVEFDLRAAIDPFADGVVITSFESEVPGEFEAGVEEGYVRIKRLPIPVLDDPPLGLKLTIGRFREELGRNNIIHLHDLPQMTRPLVIEEFFGEEGAIGNGASARVFLPTPFDEESAVELTAQAFTGGGIAVADAPPHRPQYVGNLRWFRGFGESHSVDLSLIFDFGRTASGDDVNAFTYSADFLYRWKPLRGGEFQSFLLGGQALLSKRDFLLALDTDGDREPDLAEKVDASPFGYYAWAQYQLSRSSYLGVRWDDTATIDDDSVRRHAIGGYLTWYTSEFLRFRFGYERRISDVSEEDGRNSAFAELNFVFGAHPTEPFWVNK